MPRKILAFPVLFYPKNLLLEPNSFHISANGEEVDENPPTFISVSNSATFRFTSDDSDAYAGILMLYQLSECVI